MPGFTEHHDVLLCLDSTLYHTSMEAAEYVLGNNQHAWHHVYAVLSGSATRYGHLSTDYPAPLAFLSLNDGVNLAYALIKLPLTICDNCKPVTNSTAQYKLQKSKTVRQQCTIHMTRQCALQQLHKGTAVKTQLYSII